MDSLGVAIVKLPAIARKDRDGSRVGRLRVRERVSDEIDKRGYRSLAPMMG